MKPIVSLAAAVVASCVVASADAQTPGLQAGDRVAICGDSITQQHMYSADIEAYLACCRPVAGVTAEQFGWGGETAGGFHQRMPRFMLPFGNNVATTCYGMNDGRYNAMTPDTAKVYRDSQTAIVKSLKAAGYRFIVLGSSGPVDTQTFSMGAKAAAAYNQTLAGLRDIDREVAQQQGVAFADVYDAVYDVMAKAKAKYGERYPVCGASDGIHPQANGHLVMAYAFLKALGVSGDVGTITLDLAGQKATATDGHKVLSCEGGTIQMESTRYPFCFSGDPASPDATTGVIQFFPFNDDLNRFRLVVTNPGAGRVRVTFGPASKEFAAADAARGINLAAEFLDNPFAQPFAAELKKIQAKQNVESLLDMGFYNSIPALEAQLPAAKGAYEATEGPIRDLLAAQAKAIPESVPPVRYAIKVEPVR
jgi:lysophospholipase L1-like esterase